MYLSLLPPVKTIAFPTMSGHVYNENIIRFKQEANNHELCSQITMTLNQTRQKEM